MRRRAPAGMQKRPRRPARRRKAGKKAFSDHFPTVANSCAFGQMREDDDWLTICSALISLTAAEIRRAKGRRL